MGKITKKGNHILVPDHVTIPYIGGDGVGHEITPVSQEIVNAAIKQAYNGTRSIEWKEVLAGEKALKQTGNWLPDETMEAFREYIVGIKGPSTTPIGEGIRSLNVTLRQTLNLYVCLRPIRWSKGVISPVKEPQKVNMYIFRENTGGIYAGTEWQQGTPEAQKLLKFLTGETGVKKIRFPETSSLGIKPVSVEGTERLVHATIEYAILHRLSSVILVRRSNIMEFTKGGFKLWGYVSAEREFADLTFTWPQYEKIKKEQGEEAANTALVEASKAGKIIIKDVTADAFLQNILLTPEEYSAIATSNLNGDYISDQLAAIVGGIDTAPGTNINYNSGHAIFEATHGTTPNITGKNLVNPFSLLLSPVMMLEYMGRNDAANLIMSAMEQAFSTGEATHDLARSMPNGRSLDTREFGDCIISIIETIKLV